MECEYCGGECSQIEEDGVLIWECERCGAWQEEEYDEFADEQDDEDEDAG